MVNIHLDLVSVNIHQCSLRLWRIIVKYIRLRYMLSSFSQLTEGNGYETRQTSKKGTKMPRFVLEGPRPSKIFFCAHTPCMNYVTTTFLLVSYSVSSVQGQGQKRDQKHTTKNFGEFHNPLLLTMLRLRLLELTRQTLACKSSSLSYSTFKDCSMHKSVGP